MQTFDEVPVDALVWCRPDRQTHRFELRRDQAVVSTLIFDPPPTFAWGQTARRSALAEGANSKWSLTVRRRGFLGMKGDVQVQGANSGALEAGYLLRRGTLTISEMQDYQWLGGIAEGSFDVFTDLQGMPVLRLDRGDMFEGINARVSVLSGAAPARDVVLLATVGLYMRLLMDKVYE